MIPAEAQQRLQQAFDRLEAAAHKAKAQSGSHDPTSQPDVESLRQDRDRLSADLAKVRQDYAALEHITTTAEARLDAAIARLRTALGD